jgi:hypothetical protein
MITLGMVSIESDNQISQTFTIGELSEHQSKKLIPTSEMLHIFVAIVLANNVIEFVSV